MCMGLGGAEGGDKNTPKPTVVMLHVSVNKKNYSIIYFKYVSYIVCELYLNKTVI